MINLKYLVSFLCFTSCLGFTTLGGLWSKNYWQTGDIFETNNKYERSHTYRINFQETFTQNPKVAVSLYGFDLSYQNAGIRVMVTTIRRNYFILRVVAPANAYVYMAGVSWIATTDPKIEFRTIALTSGNTGSLASGSGLRYERRQAYFPGAWREAKATVALSGFQYSGTGNARLDLKVSNTYRRYANIDFSVWADTTCNMAYATVILYDQNADYLGSFNVQSSVTGNLYKGSGARNDVQTGGSGLGLNGDYGENNEIEISNSNVQFCYALNHIDFIYGKNYRVDQSFDVQDDALSVTFKTWADTQIWQVTDSVFYALH